jgi:hypothetical protein
LLLLLLLCCPAPLAAGEGAEAEEQIEGTLEEVVVTGREPRSGVVERIDAQALSRLAGASGSFENILKILPGVHSSNELSAQYSVRGGSYDENLVYVNGVEIYRPMLTRTGQQEGLSFINPNMTSAIDFSTGGFGAEFGDKMSSVLNVAYRQPTAFGGSAEANMLGASAACDFAFPEKKLGGVVGMRYKRATYLLGTLDVKGEYNPSFSDLQTAIYFAPVRNLTLNLLGSYALNRYRFTPVNRETTFGTLDNPTTFTMYYEGGEDDLTQNLLGALTAKYRVSDNVVLGFTGSAVAMLEQERYDILGEYWLKQSASGAAAADDNSADIGVGSSFDHARTVAATSVYAAEHSGSWYHRRGALKWGVKALRYRVYDEVSRWQRVDSAGYMMPRSEGNLNVMSSAHADASVGAWQYSLFVQEAYGVGVGGGHLLRVTPGVRVTAVALNRELLISPRLQAVFYPYGRKNRQLFVAAGAYHQPAFFKEMKNPAMQLRTDLTAQRSWHLTLGASATFAWHDIPFRLTSEAYYKRLLDLIPYRQDNVALLYDWRHRADGFVWGVDARLSAALVSGAESWVSLSLMQAQQDVQGDAYRDGDGQTRYPGYFPMPNDQRLNLSILLQDHLPALPQWRACLSLCYGTGLPALAPADDRYDLTFRMPPYRRVDAGLSYVLFDKAQGAPLKELLGGALQSGAITLEVLNLFNARNVSSYLWVRTVQYAGQPSGMVAVPNYLTPFRLNLKLGITF